MLVGAIGLALIVLRLDRTLKHGVIQEFGGWIYTGGPQGARTLLSTIASSMINIAGVTFSLVVVALQLASSQFGPRLLRNFMRDTGNQLVLGTFLATFIYCLIVLRTIREDKDNVFVPNISITVAVVLAFASLGVLIYFIHHMAEAIQADNLIAKVNRELDDAIERLFPMKLGQEPPKQRRWLEEIPADFDREACPIMAARSGYIQGIDNNKLMKIATKNNLLLRLKSRPGKFVVKGSEIIRAWPRQRVNEQLARQLDNSFLWGVQRTEQQDVEYPLNRLVEIAVRALSPAVNDPFTAIRCIDRLGEALCHLAAKDIPSPYRYDEENKLRVIADPVTFAGMTDAAFNQIRQYGQSSAAVTIRLLETLAVVAAHTHNQKDCAALLHHANMIRRGSDAGLPEEQDRKDVEARYQAVVRALEH